MIDLRLLGAFDVSSNQPDGRRGSVLTQPKRLALLLYLTLAEPAGLHSRDQLLALLWPRASEDSSRHSLRNALHALRRAFGEDAIITRGESYVGINPDWLICDVLQVRAHLSAGSIDEAVALWQGELTPGFFVSGAPSFERWLDYQRNALHSALRTAAWKRARALKGSGQLELDAVRSALRLDPGDEQGVQWLMQLLAAAGDRRGSLRAYDDLCAYLEQELDAQPSTSTRSLAATVRSMDVERPALPIAMPNPDTIAISAAKTSLVLPAVESPTVAPLPRRRFVTGAGLISVLSALAVIAILTLGNRSHFMDRPSTTGLPSSPEAEAQRAVLRLPTRYRQDTASYKSYLHGLTLRFQFRFLESRDTLAALVDREPLYVPGLFGLAHAYAFAALNNLTDPEESWRKIHALAVRALALDSTAASAWLALAAEDMYAQHDPVRAQERIAHARNLDSLDPDVAAMQSVLSRFSGDMDNAVAEARLAHRLDPLSPLFERLVGKQLYFARRYEESRASFATMVQGNPGWPRNYSDFADLYMVMGRHRDAVDWRRRAKLAVGDSIGAAGLVSTNTDSAALRLLDDDAHRTIAQLEQLARNGTRVAPSKYAAVYATLRDTGRTLQWLDSVRVHRDSYALQVRVDPAFDFLRRDPRYRAWDARSGLPKPLE